MAMPRTVNYRPYLFNQIADFGRPKTVTNRNNGMQVAKFVKEFSLHVFPQKTTLNRLYETIGTQYEDSITLVIQHNPKVNDSLQVVYKGKTYKIINISVDDSANYVTYDFLTLQLIKKAGNANGWIW